MSGFKYLGLVSLIAGALLAGCSSAPTSRNPGNVSERAAHYALEMKGKPYRYGGSTPRGFDCSGLVYYSYRRAGARVPRTTSALWRNSRGISQRALRPGDLLFFNQEGKRSSHVALYLGSYRFIHAPSSGKHVSISSLRSAYWQRHLEGVRRLHLD